ncbi:MAG: DUF2851 family protein [Akkermansia sp.]|nr:DUF2851 family protein [Akkermansia sp.]
MNTPRQYLAEQYKELLAEVYAGAVAAPVTQALPPELQVQSWWAEGLVSTDGGTLRHGKVRILDRGRWNRCPGPDFTHAEIELNGTRIRGDIEIDPCAQAWEQHGHGANPSFNQVALHVVLSPPTARLVHTQQPAPGYSHSLYSTGKLEHLRNLRQTGG